MKSCDISTSSCVQPTKRCCWSSCLRPHSILKRCCWPIIDITGVAGPRVSGIAISSVVFEAVRDGTWNLPRGRHPIVQLLRTCLQSHSPPLSSEIGEDYYLWKTDSAQAQGTFSSSKTWRHLHPTGPSVPWHSQVWFKEKIPKLAFLFWLTVQNRLTTRDRLRSWNLPVPTSCLLCHSGEESRDHLFFQCTFSQVLLSDFFAPFNPPTSSSFSSLLIWIKSPATNRKLIAICKIVFHALVYYIWMERNTRLHSSSIRSEIQIKREIQLLLRRRLAGLDRAAASSSTSPNQETYLSLWFANFQYEQNLIYLFLVALSLVRSQHYFLHSLF